MPYTTFVKDKFGTDRKTYNFDGPVSTFGGGDSVDVMLLQALFRMFYYELNAIDPPSAASGVIVVDGVCGAQTRIHIQDFQNSLRLHGALTVCDGVIDPFKKQGVLTSLTHRKYQLAILNDACFTRAFDANTPEVYLNMTDEVQHGDDIYPDELRNALQTVRPMN